MYNKQRYCTRWKMNSFVRNESREPGSQVKRWFCWFCATSTWRFLKTGSGATSLLTRLCFVLPLSFVQWIGKTAVIVIQYDELYEMFYAISMPEKLISISSFYALLLDNDSIKCKTFNVGQHSKNSCSQLSFLSS